MLMLGIGELEPLAMTQASRCDYGQNSIGGHTPCQYQSTQPLQTPKSYSPGA